MTDALNVLMRWLHITSVVMLIGGVLFQAGGGAFRRGPRSRPAGDSWRRHGRAVSLTALPGGALSAGDQDLQLRHEHGPRAALSGAAGNQDTARAARFRGWISHRCAA